MFDINPITGISREIREWVKYRDEKNAAKTEAELEAAEALSQAVLSTRQHVNALIETGRTEASESTLVELWSRASDKFRKVDPDLANRCFAKAEYWVRPQDWSAERINEYNIALDSMSDSVRLMKDR